MTIATLATVAIAPVDSVLKAAQKSVTSPATEQLTSKFEAMMQAPKAEQLRTAQAANAPQAPAGPNAITQLVDKQQSLMQKSFSDARAFTANASNLSMQEVAAQSMKLSHDMTMANFNLQSITAVAQGSNKSLQTLLKNQ